MLWRHIFFAFSNSRDPNWVNTAAPTKINEANIHPILATVKGIERMPEPITVLMMVVTVRHRSD